MRGAGGELRRGGAGYGEDVVAALLRLADQVGLPGRREAMFSGERINTTENRAVLHTALRAPSSLDLQVDGQDVTGLLLFNGRFCWQMPDVRARLHPGMTFADYIQVVSRSAMLRLPAGQTPEDWAETVYRPEIAARMGCTPKTVDNALQRVKRKVLTHLRSREVLDLR